MHRSGTILCAFAAWAVALVIASSSWISIVAYRGAHAADEPLAALAFIFPVVMSIPLAAIIGVVMLPVVVGVRSLIGNRRVWLSLAGAAAAPVGIVAMIATGRLLFLSPRPTLSADLRAAAGNPQDLAPLLLALVIAGITLGVGCSRRESRPA